MNDIWPHVLMWLVMGGIFLGAALLGLGLRCGTCG